MPITLSIPATIANDVSAYAAGKGMTINDFIMDYLVKTAELARGKRTPKIGSLDEFCGIITHEEANELRAIVNEQRKIDEELWK